MTDDFLSLFLSPEMIIIKSNSNSNPRNELVCHSTSSQMMDNNNKQKKTESNSFEYYIGYIYIWVRPHELNDDDDNRYKFNRNKYT